MDTQTEKITSDRLSEIYMNGTVEEYICKMFSELRQLPPNQSLTEDKKNVFTNLLGIINNYDQLAAMQYLFMPAVDKNELHHDRAFHFNSFDALISARNEAITEDIKLINQINTDNINSFSKNIDVTDFYNTQYNNLPLLKDNDENTGMFLILIGKQKEESYLIDNAKKNVPVINVSYKNHPNRLFRMLYYLKKWFIRQGSAIKTLVVTSFGLLIVTITAQFNPLFNKTAEESNIEPDLTTTASE
ncbi:hypothetical protein NEOKW01_0051 [Nematocida sp. AWRm80]|nr:hypothetical protein NEOKW01_0051 [Nematocida sp. AWRm80]